MTFVKTKNLIHLIWNLTNYSKLGDIPVYVQVQDKIYPIRDISCLINLNNHDDAIVINISDICGGSIPKDCITCGNNVFGECYHYHKDVLDNQCYCGKRHWKSLVKE